MNKRPQQVDVQTLDQCVAELKGSVTIFVESARGEHPELDSYLDSMLQKLHCEQHALTFSHLVNQYQSRRQEFHLQQAEAGRDERLALLRLVEECAGRELSTGQTELARKLLRDARDPASSEQDILLQLATLVSHMAEEIDTTRQNARKVVDDKHKHIKQNSANVVAADIQTASKRLTREIATLSKKLSSSYPEDASLSTLKSAADEIVNQPNQFFKSLELLQDMNRHISLLIQKERFGTQQILRDIHEKIAGIISTSALIQATLLESDVGASAVSENVTARFEMLTRQAQHTDSVEDLRSIIDQSIASVSGVIDAFASQQKKLNLRNKNTIASLSKEARLAGEKIRIMNNKLQSAQEDAFLDELSQTGNRRGYLKRLEIAHALWRQQRQALSLIILDIDRFKKINDRYGHTVGDQIIRKIGQILKQGVRESDYVARYGGEEFVIICNGASGKQAAHMAELIRQTVYKRNFRLRDSDDVIKVTASFGVAEFTDETATIADVFKAADNALYCAKDSGRNHVTLMDGSTMVSLR